MAAKKLKYIKCSMCAGTGKSKKQFDKIKGKLVPMTCIFCAGNGRVPVIQNPTMTRSQAKRKIQTLVDKIERETGSLCWLSVISEKGKVDFVIVNSIEGGSPSTARKMIRSWAKLNKVMLRWLNADGTTHRKVKPKTGPKKRRARRPKKNAPQIPPPFKKLTTRKIDKLKNIFRVHDGQPVENPDPGDCPHCGMKYDDFKTGLDFEAVKDMLWIQDSNPEYWRHKRRGSVLGLWFEIKRSMWADHQDMCGGEPISEKEYLDHLETFDEY